MYTYGLGRIGGILSNCVRGNGLGSEWLRFCTHIFHDYCMMAMCETVWLLFLLHVFACPKGDSEQTMQELNLFGLVFMPLEFVSECA